MEKNNTQLALDILRGMWLLRDAETFLPYAQAFVNHEPPIIQDEELASPRLYSDYGEREESPEAPSEQKKVAIVPLHGAMIKYASCASIGTLEIAQWLTDFASQDDIVGIVLDIDSPGGALNAIMPLVQAIETVKASGKPIIAHCDQCASAALWVATQCDNIYMDNKMSEIGSLGAYASIFDNRNNLATGEKIITIYADESSDKNKAVREALEGKYESMKKELSTVVSNFIEAVTTGRPSLKTKEEGVTTGAMFYTAEAITTGFADGQLTLKECIENVFVRAEMNK